MKENRFTGSNINYIIDISRLSKNFYDNYFQIDNLVGHYLICLLAKKMDSLAETKEDNFIDVFQINDIQLNPVFQDLIHGRTTQDQVLNSMYADMSNNVEFVDMANDIFDLVGKSIYDIVSTVKNNSERYLQHQVLMEYFFISKNTLIVSFKTVRMNRG